MLLLFFFNVWLESETEKNTAQASEWLCDVIGNPELNKAPRFLPDRVKGMRKKHRDKVAHFLFLLLQIESRASHT